MEVLACYKQNSVYLSQEAFLIKIITRKPFLLKTQHSYQVPQQYRHQNNNYQFFSFSSIFLNFMKYGNQYLLYCQITMEETILSSPNNDGRILKLQIKQKNAHIRKRKVKTWTPDEDERLIKLYEEYPKKWGVIANLMNDRNQNQCLHRYRRLSQLGAHKKIWSVEEDHSIINLIKKVGKNWKVLSQMIGTKTGKQIRERFINKLDPRIKTEQWTDEEDRLILKFYSEVGSRWSEISKRLPGRPQNKIKNRFYSYIQKNYDIKYSYIEPNLPNQNLPKKQQGKKLRQICLNQSQEKQGPYQKVSLGKQNNFSYKQIPSIKEIEGVEYRNNQQEDKDQIFDSNIHIGNKFYLKSLIRVDEQLGSIQCKYRSIRDIISNNQLENQNDLFYMGQ